MNPCISCGLQMPPGSSHADPSACVLALRHEMEKASTCAGCKAEINVHVCPRCSAAAFGKGLLGKGVNALAPPALEWLRGLAGDPGSGEGGNPGPTSPTSGGGRRWTG